MIENLIAEIFDIILSGIIGFYIGRFKRIKQFYSAIIPVVKRLRELKDLYKISNEDTPSYVRLISTPAILSILQ